MAPQVVADFFAIMLLGGALAVLSTMKSTVRERLRPMSLPLAAGVAVGATAGSLYFSEVANYVPCELCWFQRIAMYPLAVIIGIAALRNDRTVRRHALPLAVIGIGIALYHVQLQAFPDQGSFCALASPCTASPVKALGVFTIPQMSATAFVILARVLWLIPANPSRTEL